MVRDGCAGIPNLSHYFDNTTELMALDFILT